MQINLIPKTKQEEKERKRNKIILTSIILGIFAVTTAIILVLLGINGVQRVTISSLDKGTEDTKESLESYRELEKNVTTMITGLSSIKQILENRSNWLNIDKEVDTLTPGGVQILQFSGSENKITLKTEAISVRKIADFINALESYEIAITKDGKLTKTKLFTEVDVANFTKDESKEKGTMYNFDVKLTFTEEIWKKE